MAPTIPIATQKMATQIEDESLPWYLDNTVIDPEKVEVLQYKNLMKAK